MNLTITKCTDEHIDAAIDALADIRLVTVLENAKGLPYSLSIVLDKTLLLIGGIVVVRRGVAECWLTVVDPVTIRRRIKTVVKAIRTMLRNLADSGEIWRMQASSRVDKPENGRFLRLLGFEKEGILRCYGDDRADFEGYALIYEH